MDLTRPVAESPGAYLRSAQPDAPVFFFAPRIVQQNARSFQRGFAGLVSYAVKANPDPMVLENLLAAGISAFDVASPSEFRGVRNLAPGATLHYHNPVRSRHEIAAALECGITSFSVDRPQELAKLAALAQGRILETSIRLALPVSGGAYHFGDKFGAPPDLAVELLQGAATFGFTPSMTFHPGTQCTDPAAWDTYINACARIARRAGIRLARLNVGGGFPSHRGLDAPELPPIFAGISAAVARAFRGHEPALICEPGRAMVAEAFTLATRVKAIGEDGSVFLNDGIYGGLAELPSIGTQARITAISSAGSAIPGPATPRRVFGPTCDSLDVLPEKINLPNAIAEDDYVLFAGNGAYSTALSTRFNGYGNHAVVTLMPKMTQTCA